MTTATDLIRAQIHDLEHTIAERERTGQQSSEALDLAIMRIDHDHKVAVDLLKAQRREAIVAARIEHGTDEPTAVLRAEHRRLTQALAMLDPDGSGYRCPECAQRFTTAAGLGGHRQKVHGVHGVAGKPAKPKPAIVAVPAKPKAATAPDVGPYLQCDACSTAFPVDRPEALVRHIERGHGRRPTKAERTPRRAEP